MRRSLVVVLLVGASLSVAGRAEAHICSTGVQIPVGQPASVALVITVEDQPIGDVEINLPAQLQVVGDVVAPDGWTVTTRGQTLRYRGGPFSPLTCPSFTITAQASEKGVFPVEYVQRDASGKIVARSALATNSQPAVAPVIYAGVKPSSGSAGSGPPLVIVAGVALIAIAVLLFGALLFRSRRLARADAREEELEDRVAAFKKQAQDRKEQTRR